MEKLLRILQDLLPQVDVKHDQHLIDDHLLDSLAILALVSELEEEFDILIPAVDIIPDHFNSADQLWALIVRLQQEG